MYTVSGILEKCGLEKCKEKHDLPTLQAYFLTPIDEKNSCQKSLSISNIKSLDSWLSWIGCVPRFDVNGFEKHIGVDLKQYQQLKDQIIENQSNTLDDPEKWFGTGAVFEHEKEVVFIQKVVVPRDGKILIIGDIHCSLTSVLNIFSHWKQKGWLRDDFSLAPQVYVFFLGDVFDRGPYGTELLTLIFLLKLANGQRVVYINGNHENCETFTTYGMATEVKEKFSPQITNGARLLTHLLQHMSFLQYQPSAAIVKYGEHMFQFTHGAFTDNVREQFAIANFCKSDKSFLFLRDFAFRCKPIVANSVDNQKWGDFIGTKEDSLFNKRGKNAGKVFGWHTTLQYLNKVGLSAIISGHQDLSNFTMLTMPTQSKQGKEMDPNYKTLYRPVNYGKPFFNQVVSFQPGTDFIAVNTSTALDSKGNNALMYDCFLVLSFV